MTRAVRQAMTRITEHHPQLGQHLSRTIRTGTYCAYVPTLAPPPTGESDIDRRQLSAAGFVALVITFNFDGLTFESPGVHEFILNMDGTELGRIGFKVLVAGRSAPTGTLP